MAPTESCGSSRFAPCDGGSAPGVTHSRQRHRGLECVDLLEGAAAAGLGHPGHQGEVAVPVPGDDGPLDEPPFRRAAARASRGGTRTEPKRPSRRQSSSKESAAGAPLRRSRGRGSAPGAARWAAPARRAGRRIRRPSAAQGSPWPAGGSLTSELPGFEQGPTLRQGQREPHFLVRDPALGSGPRRDRLGRAGLRRDVANESSAG